MYKVAYLGTDTLDGAIPYKKWQMIAMKKNSHKVYERCETDDNYHWYYDNHEVLGKQRNVLEHAFCTKLEQRKRYSTFEVLTSGHQMNILDTEVEIIRMRKGASIYERRDGSWIRQTKNKIVLVSNEAALESLYQYALKNDLIGTKISINKVQNQDIEPED